MATGVDDVRAGSIPRSSSVPGALRVPFVAGLVLFFAYVAMSFLLDPGGFLGTDTGGKVATVKVMSERGDFDPDVGYWAAEWDPEGRVHGLYYTSVIGDRYVNVTSLPMILAARPLWDVGGYRATLVLPMLGLVAVAFAARALSRRLAVGAERSDDGVAGAGSLPLGDDGWTSFWIIGLASPVVIYALDLWEHSLGLALMAWGVVAGFDAVFRRPTWWRGLLLGAAFGGAAAMRTEAFAYVATTTALCCISLVLTRRRDIGRAVVLGAAAVVGFLAAFGLNLMIEQAVLGEPMRSSRATGAASTGLTGFGTRFEEGLTTLFSPFPTRAGSGWAIGLCLAILLVMVARRATSAHPPPPVVIAAAVATFIFLWRFVDGAGFVPGMIPTTPFVAVALAWGWGDAHRRFLLLLAFVPVPLVVAFQFTGGAAPQWAGRYLLLSGLLAAIVGVSERHRLAPWARAGFIGLSVAVTAFGVVWLAQRSHDIADAGARLNAREEAVLLTPNGFVLREFGARYGEQRWLSSGSAEDFDFAVEVITRSGLEDFALVRIPTGHEPPELAGWRAVGTESVPFVSTVDFEVTTYERVG